MAVSGLLISCESRARNCPRAESFSAWATFSRARWTGSGGAVPSRATVAAARPYPSFLMNAATSSDFFASLSFTGSTRMRSAGSTLRARSCN